jgi:hypothetical protein
MFQCTTLRCECLQCAVAYLESQVSDQRPHQGHQCGDKEDSPVPVQGGGLPRRQLLNPHSMRQTVEPLGLVSLCKE